MNKRHLKIVRNDATLENEIQLLLIERRQAIRHLAEVEAELLPLRKRYAAERGEFMLPTIERLLRELL